MGLDVCDAAMENGPEYVRSLVATAKLVEPTVQLVHDADLRVSRDEGRRKLQKEENVRIQETAFHLALPRIMTVAEMNADCVWVAGGSQVGRISNPREVLSFTDFLGLTAASNTPRQDNPTKSIPNALLWKKSESRKTVHTQTFHAGAPVICEDPDGLAALNSWRKIERRTATADIGPFLGQVEYLFAEANERERFLDWLAHIEQFPGVLPHYGWLHIAKNTGAGRNWLASVLARVWRGYVAPNVDLPALLDSQYNAGLAGRVLAIVDEVQEGGGENQFRLANRLKSVVNAEYRLINPKFGRQFKEHNSCRWLVFSNHDNALPMQDTDRRWRVVRHSAAPRAAETYSKLYAQLNDPEFINAVGVFLCNRDILSFNPGERPPMNEAKRSAVSASKTLIQLAAEDLVARWPADVIMNEDIVAVLSDGGEGKVNSAMRRALEELGAAPYGKTIKPARRNPGRCWLLRNPGAWCDATHGQLVAEVGRARPGDWRSAFDVLAGSAVVQ